MRFKKGDLVRWVTEYDDGLVKNAGIGLILGSTEYVYQDVTHTSYIVYRNEVGDEISISDRNVFKLHQKEK